MKSSGTFSLNAAIERASFLARGLGVAARLRAQFQEQWPTDLVDAVLATGDADPVALEARLTAMSSLASSADFGPMKTTFKRVMGLTREHSSNEYDLQALNEPAEQVQPAPPVAARVYRSKQKLCPDCGKVMAATNIRRHLKEACQGGGANP